MKNLSYVGLCWAMTLGLVAVAIGQQQRYDSVFVPVAQQPLQVGPDAIAEPGFHEGTVGQQRSMPAPEAPQDRSLITGTYQPAQPAMNGERRGELGVWMIESNGPGVQIQRITRGSAADQAGLREGDFILQVNGRGATSPQGTAQLIRQIAIGQAGTLTIWRDGNQQQVQITMQPMRELARDIAGEPSHQVGFGPPDTSASGDLVSRTMKLEQQISSLTQELDAMRQELAQLRSTGPVQTSFNAEPNPNAPRQGSTLQNQPQDNWEPAASTPGVAPTNPVSPPPGFEQPADKPVKAAAESTKPNTPAAPAAEPAKSAAPAPAAEKSAASDPFGSDSPQPKTEEKPKAQEQPKASDGKDTKDATDDLFK